jgi:hypothetical protein
MLPASRARILFESEKWFSFIHLQLLGKSAALLHQQPCVQGLRAAAVADDFTAASLNMCTVIIPKHTYIHIQQFR